MCGKALPFRADLFEVRGCASNNFPGIASEIKKQLSERLSLSAHQAAKPRQRFPDRFDHLWQPQRNENWISAPFRQEALRNTKSFFVSPALSKSSQLNWDSHRALL